MSNKALDYKITGAKIFADRFATTANDNPIDIKNSIMELNIIENISLPYLNGNIVLADYISLSHLIKFKGTERIEITIQNIAGVEIKKDFIITNISFQKNGNKANILILDIIDEFGYYLNIVRTSKAYKGKIYDILNNIYEQSKVSNNEILDTKLDKSGSIDNREITYVSPNERLLDTFQKLKQRAISDKGAPVFVYPSFTDDSLKISDLKTLLDKNENYLLSSPELSFIFAQDNAASFGQDVPNENSPNPDTNEFGKIVKHRYIKNMVLTNNLHNSTFVLSQGGNTFSEISVFDATTGAMTKERININDIVSDFFDEANENQIVDDAFTFKDGQPITDIEMNKFSMITSSFLFSDNDGYLSENSDMVRYKNLLQSKAIKSLLKSTEYTIQLSGGLFGLVHRNSGVGSLINIKYFNNPQYKGDNITLLDRERSGIYLTMAVKHSMKNGIHTVTADIVKLYENVGELK